MRSTLSSPNEVAIVLVPNHPVNSVAMNGLIVDQTSCSGRDVLAGVNEHCDIADNTNYEESKSKSESPSVLLTERKNHEVTPVLTTDPSMKSPARLETLRTRTFHSPQGGEQLVTATEEEGTNQVTNQDFEMKQDGAIKSPASELEQNCAPKIPNSLDSESENPNSCVRNLTSREVVGITQIMNDELSASLTLARRFDSDVGANKNVNNQSNTIFEQVEESTLSPSLPTPTPPQPLPNDLSDSPPRVGTETIDQKETQQKTPAPEEQPSNTQNVSPRAEPQQLEPPVRDDFNPISPPPDVQARDERRIEPTTQQGSNTAAQISSVDQNHRSRESSNQPEQESTVEDHTKCELGYTSTQREVGTSSISQNLASRQSPKGTSLEEAELSTRRLLVKYTDPENGTCFDSHTLPTSDKVEEIVKQMNHVSKCKDKPATHASHPSIVRNLRSRVIGPKRLIMRYSHPEDGGTEYTHTILLSTPQPSDSDGENTDSDTDKDSDSDSDTDSHSHIDSDSESSNTSSDSNNVSGSDAKCSLGSDSDSASDSESDSGTEPLAGSSSGAETDSFSGSNGEADRMAGASATNCSGMFSDTDIDTESSSATSPKQYSVEKRVTRACSTARTKSLSKRKGEVRRVNVDSSCRRTAKVPNEKSKKRMATRSFHRDEKPRKKRKPTVNESAKKPKPEKKTSPKKRKRTTKGPAKTFNARNNSLSTVMEVEDLDRIRSENASVLLHEAWEVNGTSQQVGISNIEEVDTEEEVVTEEEVKKRKLPLQNETHEGTKRQKREEEPAQKRGPGRPKKCSDEQEKVVAEQPQKKPQKKAPGKVKEPPVSRRKKASRKKKKKFQLGNFEKLNPYNLVEDFREMYNFYGICEAVNFGTINKKSSMEQMSKRIEETIDKNLPDLTKDESNENKAEYKNEMKLYNNSVRVYSGRRDQERSDKQREKEEYDLRLREFTYYRGSQKKTTEAQNEVKKLLTRPIRLESSSDSRPRKLSMSLRVRSADNKEEEQHCSVPNCLLCSKSDIEAPNSQQQQPHSQQDEQQQQQLQQQSSSFLPLPSCKEISLSDPEFMRVAEYFEGENSDEDRKGRTTGNKGRGRGRGGTKSSRRRSNRGGFQKRYETSLLLQEMKHSLSFIEEYNNGMIGRTDEEDE